MVAVLKTGACHLLLLKRAILIGCPIATLAPPLAFQWSCSTPRGSQCIDQSIVDPPPPPSRTRIRKHSELCGCGPYRSCQPYGSCDAVHSPAANLAQQSPHVPTSPAQALAGAHAWTPHKPSARCPHQYVYAPRCLGTTAQQHRHHREPQTISGNP